ncbi:winged helix-turn-helix transcriptional regulator [Peteryoungia ipomoeae]|uniref:winged helix-turn-helix transcriptional regulator n=1 Tax=Peteryoungia ipomoeae TaxID=1210932 RepID=UPI002482E3C7|nr:winged helix-turn-helix transcriptional regulator [Peteryoungia ipomoeae]
MATNVLSDRLARLEATGFVTKARDPADGRRHVYSLTDKGADLAPVLSAIVVWAARHTATDATADAVAALGEGGGRPAGR